jgi:hypothetical protein
MNLKYWLLRRLFKYLSPFISVFEKNKIKKYSQLETNYDPVFIIGPPRSGSTILYQLITNFYDVSYINNLCHLSRKNFYFGFWLSNVLYKNKKHNIFKSNYGNTQKSGLNAPSEGGQIWYRWFSKNKIYYEKDDLSEEDILEIRNTFNAITNRFQKPIVIKNLMFSQRLNVLANIFPTAKIIFIKRSPEFNAQSIYLARKKQANDQWWSVKPVNHEELSKLSLIEQSVSQVFYLEKQIHEDLKQFSAENITIIKYEELITNCVNVLDHLREFINANKKADYSEFSLESKDKIKINEEEFKLILKIVNKFDWNQYNLKQNVE